MLVWNQFEQIISIYFIKTFLAFKRVILVFSRTIGAETYKSIIRHLIMVQTQTLILMELQIIVHWIEAQHRQTDIWPPNVRIRYRVQAQLWKDYNIMYNGFLNLSFVLICATGCVLRFISYNLSGCFLNFTVSGNIFCPISFRILGRFRTFVRKCISFDLFL